MLKITRHHLKDDHSAPMPIADDPYVGVQETHLWPKGMHLLIKLNNQLRDAHGIGTLTITFGIKLKKIAQSGKPISVDLSKFERSRLSLDKLIVNVPGIDARHGLFIDEADKIKKLWPLVKAEVARIGRVLIGPNI
jgi:hypothetical protein